MLSQALLGALSLGFLGSLHCVAMCGPIALAACQRQSARGSAALGYFGGRLCGYAFVGALFGWAGMHLMHWPLFGLAQRALWLAVAALALLKGVELFLGRPLWRPRVAWTEVFSPLRPFLPALPKRGLALGLVTAVLPCGMLAMGWALAGSTGSPFAGAAVMAVLCLASTPALVASALLAGPAGRLAQRLPRAAWGVLWCLLAVWVGARPLLGASAHEHGAPAQTHASHASE